MLWTLKLRVIVVIGLMSLLLTGASFLSCWAAGASASPVWTATQAPLPAGQSSLGQPSDVPGGVRAFDCPAAGWCTAFIDNSAGRGGYIATQEAGAWQQEAAPVPPHTESSVSLTGPLTCTRINYCVGFGSTNGPFANTYILTESGGSWTTQPIPSVAGLGTPYVDAVACPQEGSCTAVGDIGYTTPVILTESSGTWTAQEAPQPADSYFTATGQRTQLTTLVTVSCPQVGACVAGGEYPTRANSGDTAYVVTQTTTGWVASAIPPPNGQGTGGRSPEYVRSIVCVQEMRCIAVGSDNYYDYIVTEAVDGTWSSMFAPMPSDFQVNTNGGTQTYIGSLSCPTAAWCTVFGSYYPTSGQGPSGVILTDQDGSWSAQKAPTSSPSATSMGSTWGFPVACAQAGTCVAVGWEGPPAAEVLLAGDQNAWSAQASILPPGGQRFGPGGEQFIECPAIGSCSAATAYTDSNGNLQAEFLYEGGPIAPGPGPPGGGGSGETGGSGLTVQLPPPTQPLSVTVANGGGGGVAGAPDPSSLEHGLCDPGANTNWLNIAGTTFTCIVSSQVWDDPNLISAKKKCVINLGIDFLPFVKALKLPKYVKEAEAVKLSLKTLAQRLASTSYPGKLSRDAKAVDDLRTGLDLITTPDQAILTAVSSRRVLDGLITKLGKGGPQAVLKLAQGVAVVKAAVINLIKIVSGIQDLRDCETAFDGP
jgi:hypothetical protein